MDKLVMNYDVVIIDAKPGLSISSTKYGIFDDLIVCNRRLSEGISGLLKEFMNL